jgi:hypothetical protein
MTSLYEDYTTLPSSSSSSMNGYCQLCDRRLGTDLCYFCNRYFCNSCHECYHSKTCALNPQTSPAPAAQLSPSRPSTSGTGTGGGVGEAPPVCVQCGEEADQQCEQCRDFYCSRVWMGNPGCFQTYHSKGNRVNHTAVPIAVLAPAVEEEKEGRKRGGLGRGGGDGSSSQGTKSKSVKSFRRGVR